MKNPFKKFCVVLSAIFAMTLTACGGTKPVETSVEAEKDLELIAFGLREENNDEENLEHIHYLHEGRHNAVNQVEQNIYIGPYYDVNLTAQVKNTNRLSFIDLVLFSEKLNTLVVFNEGNGDYQCSTTTVFRNNMWVTDINICCQPDLIGLSENDCKDTKFVEIREISFLSHTGAIRKPNLIDCTFTKAHFYYDPELNDSCHNWGDEITITKNPTCTEEGEKSRFCKDCGRAQIVDYINPLSPTRTHSWDDGTILKQTSCSEEGEIKYHCSACGSDKIEKIAKVDHDLEIMEEVMNGDNKVVRLEKCKTCNQCFIAFDLTEYSNLYKCQKNAEVTDKEEFLLGDVASSLGSKYTCDEKDCYKINHNTAIEWKFNVSKQIENADVYMFAYYPNNNTDAPFFNTVRNEEAIEEMGGFYNLSEDSKSFDMWRYYAKSNENDFVPINPGFSYKMFFETNHLKSFKIGSFNFNTGENKFYFRESDNGYRINYGYEVRIACDSTVHLVGNPIEA